MPKEGNKEVKSQGLSIAALALGIVSIVTALLGVLAVVSGVLAIVFGAVSLKSPGRKKALTGIITGSIGILLSILVVVMVFFALPVLQTNQRDTARKSDLSRLMTDITNYQSNNRGQLPMASDLSTSGLGEVLLVTEDGVPTINTALYNVGVSCAGQEISARSYSVSIVLESGSTYCLDS